MKLIGLFIIGYLCYGCHSESPSVPQEVLGTSEKFELGMDHNFFSKILKPNTCIETLWTISQTFCRNKSQSKFTVLASDQCGSAYNCKIREDFSFIYLYEPTKKRFNIFENSLSFLRRGVPEYKIKKINKVDYFKLFYYHLLKRGYFLYRYHSGSGYVERLFQHSRLSVDSYLENTATQTLEALNILFFKHIVELKELSYQKRDGALNWLDGYIQNKELFESDWSNTILQRAEYTNEQRKEYFLFKRISDTLGEVLKKRGDNG